MEIDELGDRARQYLACSEPLTIEHKGKIIGLYFPVKQNKDAARKALARLHATVDEILSRTGMTEDEWVDAFDARS